MRGGELDVRDGRAGEVALVDRRLESVAEQIEALCGERREEAPSVAEVVSGGRVRHPGSPCQVSKRQRLGPLVRDDLGCGAQCLRPQTPVVIAIGHVPTLPGI
jgi:hypothetical protein